MWEETHGTWYVGVGACGPSQLTFWWIAAMVITLMDIPSFCPQGTQVRGSQTSSEP